MHIFIVLSGNPYEGNGMIQAFSTKEKAIEFRDKERELEDKAETFNMVEIKEISVDEEVFLNDWIPED